MAYRFLFVPTALLSSGRPGDEGPHFLVAEVSHVMISVVEIRFDPEKIGRKTFLVSKEAQFFTE